VTAVKSSKETVIAVGIARVREKYKNIKKTPGGTENIANALRAMAKSKKPKPYLVVSDVSKKEALEIKADLESRTTGTIIKNIITTTLPPLPPRPAISFKGLTYKSTQPHPTG
jgi:hypothetical protein